MVAVFDVVPDGPHRFIGDSDGGTRHIVDGSQLLGQAVVAASKTFRRHSVRTAHVVFVRAADDERPLVFTVDVLHEGRTFASAIVDVTQGDRRCASVTVLLDVEQTSVIEHADTMPDVGSPVDAVPVDMPDDRPSAAPGRAGRPERSRRRSVIPPSTPGSTTTGAIPPGPGQALIAHFTGHLSISTAMRGPPRHRHRHGPQDGVDQRDGDIGDLSRAGDLGGMDARSPRQAPYAGHGMSYVRGQVFTEHGALIASFTQDGMIRAFADDASVLAMPVAHRL